MCARRVSRVKAPFGGLGMKSYRGICLEAKQARLAVLEAKIRATPAAPPWTIAAGALEMMRAQSAILADEITLASSEVCHG